MIHLSTVSSFSLCQHRTVAAGTMLAILLLGAPSGCASDQPSRAGDAVTTSSGADTAMLREYLTGSFSSQDQAAADKDYRDIRLHIAPIWNDRDDGPWLYVEQATSDTIDKPYRQRVYRLSRGADGSLKSDVYLLPEPVLGFAGAYMQDEPLTSLAPEQLTLKSGCAVIMKWDGASKRFVGGTVGSGCESNLRGAAYATSEVTLSRDLLVSWDRGYDKDGKQVWGAEKGGYRFRKISQNPHADGASGSNTELMK